MKNRLTKLFCEDIINEESYRHFLLPEFSGDTEHQQQMGDKLGRLEDVEEELGIDLIILFKAIKDGIWYKYSNRIVRWHKHTDDFKDLDLYEQFVMNYTEKCFELLKVPTQYSGDNYDINITLYFKDYGKTWALTREELENELG